MLNNYPSGALNDRNAPYAQPEISDECRYDHPDGEECQLVAELDCPYCEKRVCSEAMTVRRIYGEYEVRSVKACEVCAYGLMVPSTPDAAAHLLNQVMDHVFYRQDAPVSERIQSASRMIDCAAFVMSSKVSEGHERIEQRIAAGEAA